MPVISGNTSGSILSVAYNIPCEIISFSLVNKSAGSITANVYIRDANGNSYSIIPYNLSLAVGEAYVSDNTVKVLAERSVYIVVSGSCDYYFSIN